MDCWLDLIILFAAVGVFHATPNTEEVDCTGATNRLEMFGVNFVTSSYNVSNGEYHWMCPPASRKCCSSLQQESRVMQLMKDKFYNIQQVFMRDLGRFTNIADLLQEKINKDMDMFQVEFKEELMESYSVPYEGNADLIQALFRILRNQGPEGQGDPAEHFDTVFSELLSRLKQSLLTRYNISKECIRANFTQVRMDNALLTARAMDPLIMTIRSHRLVLKVLRGLHHFLGDVFSNKQMARCELAVSRLFACPLCMASQPQACPVVCEQILNDCIGISSVRTPGKKWKRLMHLMGQRGLWLRDFDHYSSVLKPLIDDLKAFFSLLLNEDYYSLLVEKNLIRLCADEKYHDKNYFQRRHMHPGQQTSPYNFRGINVEDLSIGMDKISHREYSKTWMFLRNHLNHSVNAWKVIPKRLCVVMGEPEPPNSKDCWTGSDFQSRSSKREQYLNSWRQVWNRTPSVLPEVFEHIEAWTEEFQNLRYDSDDLKMLKRFEDEMEGGTLLIEQIPGSDDLDGSHHTFPTSSPPTPRYVVTAQRPKGSSLTARTASRERDFDRWTTIVPGPEIMATEANADKNLSLQTTSDMTVTLNSEVPSSVARLSARSALQVTIPALVLFAARRMC